MCWIGKKYAYAIILIQEFYWNQKKIANVANYKAILQYNIINAWKIPYRKTSKCEDLSIH